jgi:hypothetical protein
VPKKRRISGSGIREFLSSLNLPNPIQPCRIELPTSSAWIAKLETAEKEQQKAPDHSGAFELEPKTSARKSVIPSVG